MLMLSSLPLAQEASVPQEVVQPMECLEATPNSASQVCMQTACDPLLLIHLK